MPAMSDAEFAAVYDRYYPRIRGFILAGVRDPWQADDLTQETFLRARRRIGTLQDPGKLKPWLFRIAYNICRDHHRAARSPAGGLAVLDGDVAIADPRQPEKRLEQEQMSACVQRHIAMLPASYRSVLWLFDVLGFTHEEIAATLGLETGNVKVRLHRARRKLKTILEQRCHFERDERNIFVCVPAAGDASGE